MNGTNLFKIALRALHNNKLRAFLTMLGIIIGVASVITMLAIGQGSKTKHPGTDRRDGFQHDYDSSRVPTCAAVSARTPRAMQTLKLTGLRSPAQRNQTSWLPSAPNVILQRAAHLRAPTTTPTTVERRRHRLPRNPAAQRRRTARCLPKRTYRQLCQSVRHRKDHRRQPLSPTERTPWDKVIRFRPSALPRGGRAEVQRLQLHGHGPGRRSAWPLTPPYMKRLLAHHLPATASSLRPSPRNMTDHGHRRNHRNTAPQPQAEGRVTTTTSPSAASRN